MNDDDATVAALAVADAAVGGFAGDPVGLSILLDRVAVALADTSLARTGEHDVLAVADHLLRAERRLAGVDAVVQVEIDGRMIYRLTGHVRMRDFQRGHQHLSDAEIKRRWATAHDTGILTSFTGDVLPPKHPATAAAVRDGAISTDHVLEIRDVLRRIPQQLGSEVMDGAETQLAALARTLTPGDLRKAGARLLAYLDPDGTLTDDRDRRRLRDLRLSRQDRQLMSKVTGLLTPALRAKLDVILDAWAAPGMNNPDDPVSPRGAADQPGLAPEHLAAARERDDRTPGQRTHDALEALCDHILASGALGSPGRLPAELVITVSDHDLAAHSGLALTGTGALVPVADLIELAADATSHLAVFRNHTREVLYLGKATTRRGRKNRFANKAQRLALFARDPSTELRTGGGCTGPGCSEPFSRSQAHHSPEWAEGGPTDIDHLGTACGRHNRAVGTTVGQWETTIVPDGPHAGRMAWRPVQPPGTGAAPWQLNHTHHPEQPAGPNAPPTPTDRTWPSRPERALSARLGLTA